jgi:hypothetical protein
VKCSTDSGDPFMLFVTTGSPTNGRRGGTGADKGLQALLVV